MKEIEGSTIYLKKLYPLVEANLKTKSNLLMREITKFLDYRTEVLTATGPSKRLLFSDLEREKMCAIMGLNLKDIDRCIDEYTQGERYKTVDKPFNVACVLAIKFYKLNKRIKEEKLMVYILSLSLYAGLHYKYFEYLPNENIMNYTINNLSNKFKIKQLGTLGKAIEYTCVTAHETYEELILNSTDLDVRKYIMNINTRINGFLQNIANEFYINHKQGNYLNTEEDSYEEENYHITDNNSMIINRIADQVSISLVSQGINHVNAEQAAKMNQVSVTALKNAIIEIGNEFDNEIAELVTCILQVYLSEGQNSPRSIKSTHFINQCNIIYLKSNTQDAAILKIKELLDKWLTKCSVNYVKTERIATKNSFRRALYFYYVFRIRSIYNG